MLRVREVQLAREFFVLFGYLLHRGDFYLRGNVLVIYTGSASTRGFFKSRESESGGVAAWVLK